MKQLLLLCGLSVVLCSASIAQTHLVRTSRGIVEFVGLNRWTPARIQSALGYDSTDRLHACAADLAKLGFADASVLVESVEGQRYTLIMVVEPEDAPVVRFRQEPTTRIDVPAEWAEVRRVAEKPEYLSGGFLSYGAAMIGGKQSKPGQPWWAMLAERQAEQDFHTSLQAVAHSSDPILRAAGAMVLVHFADRDEAWHTLLSAIRDPNFIVRSTALQALIILGQYAARPVDWSHEEESIAAILSGTNLNALPHVLEILPKTGVSPDTARNVLKQNGSRMPLALMESSHPRLRGLAHSFLVRAAGRDYGLTVAGWRAWIFALQ